MLQQAHYLLSTLEFSKQSQSLWMAKFHIYGITLTAPVTFLCWKFDQASTIYACKNLQWLFIQLCLSKTGKMELNKSQEFSLSTTTEICLS